MSQIIVIDSTKSQEIIDITTTIENELPKDTNLCHLFLKHTSAALITADLDPGTDLDMLDAFYEMIPKLNYRHPHNPAHVRDHILSVLIGTSLTLPVKEGKFILGEWQRLILVEFNGPRQREIILTASK